MPVLLTARRARRGGAQTKDCQLTSGATFSGLVRFYEMSGAAPDYTLPTRMHTSRSHGVILAAASLAAGTLPAAAQSTISTTDKYAYAANAGWIDFRTSAADGVRVADTFLTGFAYGANFGYLSFGSPTGPANGHTYSNTTAGDFGGRPVRCVADNCDARSRCGAGRSAAHLVEAR